MCVNFFVTVHLIRAIWPTHAVLVSLYYSSIIYQLYCQYLYDIMHVIYLN